MPESPAGAKKEGRLTTAPLKISLIPADFRKGAARLRASGRRPPAARSRHWAVHQLSRVEAASRRLFSEDLKRKSEGRHDRPPDLPPPLRRHPAKRCADFPPVDAINIHAAENRRMLQPIGAIEDDFKRLRALTRAPRGAVQHIQPPLPVVGAEFTRLLPAILE